LCDEETRAFSEILGTHVQRLATIAHGDGVCTTFIPQPKKSNVTASSKSIERKKRK
jgi:predicted ArsR family transcriptional regulator